MYTVCKSGRQLKRRRERFHTETVQREREASIAKSNPKHLARDNQLSLRRECMSLYKNILREGCKHLA